MNDTLKQVIEFHQLFDHPIGNAPGDESLATRQLRIKLLFEELHELAVAGDCVKTFQDLCDSVANGLSKDPVQDGFNPDHLEELDALCDLQYVLSGKILTAGMQNIFDREFTKTHLNNMSKAHRTEEDARHTQGDNPGSTLQVRLPYYLVKRPDGKLIKPWNHQKVKLSLQP